MKGSTGDANLMGIPAVEVVVMWYSDKIKEVPRIKSNRLTAIRNDRGYPVIGSVIVTLLPYS